MFITNVQKGEGEYRSKILYAELRDNNDKLVCSATLNFILTIHYDIKSEIVNYKEMLIRQFKHYDEILK